MKVCKHLTWSFIWFLFGVCVLMFCLIVCLSIQIWLFHLQCSWHHLWNKINVHNSKLKHNVLCKWPTRNLMTTFLVHSDYILTTFLLHVGYILATIWQDFVYNLPTLWLHSDYTLITFWLHSGVILATFQLHSGYIQTKVWLHSDYILTTFWLHSDYFWLFLTGWLSD